MRGFFIRRALLGGIAGVSLLVCAVARADDVAEVVPAPSAGVESASPSDEAWGPRFRVHQDHGLYYEYVARKVTLGPLGTKTRSEDKILAGKFGAKIQVDAATFDQRGGLEKINNDVELRRGRVYTSGRAHLLGPVRYKVEMGWEGSSWVFHEVFLWFDETPFVRSVKVGHFKAPFGLESYGSSSDTLLMERSSPSEAFRPGAKLGVQLGGAAADQESTLVAGWFADGSPSDSTDASQSLARFIGRTTFLPFGKRENPDEFLLHLGLSASYNFSGKNSIRYRSRPESHLAPRLVDTGSIDATRAFLFGLETALVKGPLTLQGEYIHSRVNDEVGPDADLTGFYVVASLVLTGESPQYDGNRGLFAGVSPKQNVSWRRRSWGAWELVARYSDLDLQDGSVEGGVMSILSGGLTCHLTPYVKAMCNVGRADVDNTSGEGILDFAQVRMQWQY